MRIVIDMQGAQLAMDNGTVDAANIAFVKALAESSGHEIFLALSGLYPDTIEPIRAALDGVIPQENMRLWYAPENNFEVAAIIREAFLLHLCPDITHFINYDHPESIPFTGENLFRGKGLFTAQLMNKGGREISANESANLHDIGELFADKGNPDWISRAEQTIATWVKLLESHNPLDFLSNISGRKPRLAYVSPLPPERTGIADYSAELLPALAEFYDIELIVNQQVVEGEWINENLNVRDVDWFRDNAHLVDRVIYHFGNSHFHAYMFELLRETPGIVVLHDFFLGHLMGWMQENYHNNDWINSLKESHGFRGLKTFQQSPEQAILDFPVNAEIFDNAVSIIFHSKYSKALTRQWYGNVQQQKLYVIPHLREDTGKTNKLKARECLNIKPSSFLICSFGFIGETKLNQMLLDALTLCSYELQRTVELVFVGECPDDDYGRELKRKIEKAEFLQVKITGFADAKTFKSYLEAADLAVQLRCKSRGETSGTVLDCMNYSQPVIINANGSMAEFSDEVAVVLDDNFTINELAKTIETLFHEPEKRKRLGASAKQNILNNHSPINCAELYMHAIEESYSQIVNLNQLIELMADDIHVKKTQEIANLTKQVSKTFQQINYRKKLFVDISAICINDLKTGIQRVVRAILQEMLLTPPEGYSVEPVYLSDKGGRWHYRSACDYYFNLAGLSDTDKKDEAIDIRNCDVLLVLDFAGGLLTEAERHENLFEKIRNHGAAIYAVIYDLLPITMPEVFPPGKTSEHHEKWAKVIAKFDGVAAISKTVADEYSNWLEASNLEYPKYRRHSVSWFHLGADINNSLPTQGMPENGLQLLEKFHSEITFLMVGTIEPRKGYMEVLHAFTKLWRQGLSVNLVIVGREGWTHLPDEERRDIPETIKLIQEHHELNKKLYWFNGVSDEYLEKIYSSADVLIAASYGEGFGLPLIEAAQHKLPIIARDIPVFREVAGTGAYFFEAENDSELADSISDWLRLYELEQIPQSSVITWMTWKESTDQLLQSLKLRKY